MIYHTWAVYGKNDTELSWSIRSGADSEENQIRQLRAIFDENQTG